MCIRDRYLYNWGEYTGENILRDFEEETGATVVQESFDSNEQMYIKVANQEPYDVLVPSDYMAVSYTHLMSVSVIAMIGFVMLSGIIVNNGIVFIDYKMCIRDSYSTLSSIRGRRSLSCS